MKTDTLQSAVSELIELVRKFPEPERTTKHFSEWTIREVMAHIAGWDLQRIGELEEFLHENEVEIINDYDIFNRQVIRQKRFYSWEQLFAEFELSCTELVEAFNKIPEDKADTKIWPNKNSTPASWLQVDIAHLRDEHVSKLREVLQKLLRV